MADNWVFSEVAVFSSADDEGFGVDIAGLTDFDFAVVIVT